MTDEKLSLTRRIQLKELEILKVFQEICRCHGLCYFAIGGTCLGAVRHKGFIPWDDDVDVAMPYEDFMKFKAAASELPCGYSLLDMREVRRTWIGYSVKLFDARTTLIEGSNKPYPERYGGAFIDIFPVHGLPSGKRMSRLVSALSANLHRVGIIFRLSLSDICKLNRRVIVTWLLSLPLRLAAPHDVFERVQEKLLRRYPFGCSGEVIFPWRTDKPGQNGWYKNIFPAGLFGTLTELPFEDTTVAVPSGYDDYLTLEFGDYMMLPPEDKRISHTEEAFVDLGRPYSYYMNHPEEVMR